MWGLPSLFEARQHSARLSFCGRGLYGTRPRAETKATKFKAIREALRTAKRIWLATDYYEYRGQVMRVTIGGAPLVGRRRGDSPRCGPLGRRRRRRDLLRRGAFDRGSISRRLSSGRCRYGDALLGTSGPIFPNGFNFARLQVP
jgi:hypothetical protein